MLLHVFVQQAPVPNIELVCCHQQPRLDIRKWKAYLSTVSEVCKQIVQITTMDIVILEETSQYGCICG